MIKITTYEDFWYYVNIYPSAYDEVITLAIDNIYKAVFLLEVKKIPGSKIAIGLLGEACMELIAEDDPTYFNTPKDKMSEIQRKKFEWVCKYFVPLVAFERDFIDKDKLA